MPERFLKNEFGLLDPTPDQMKEWRNTYAFGAGRRICPGIHLVSNSLNINIVNLLWAFNFLKLANAETGETIEPDVRDFGTDIAISPRPFQCRIVPRSEKHAELVREEFLRASDAFEPFEGRLSPDDKAFVNKQREEVRLLFVSRKDV